MAIGIGVIGKRDVEFPAQADQSLHRVGRRAIHPDLSIPIDGHESKGRVDGVVHHGRRDLVAIDDRRPVLDGSPTQRVDADSDAAYANLCHVDDVREVADIGRDVIVRMNAGCFARALQRNAMHASELLLEEIVRGGFDPAGNVDVGGPAIGGIILEASVLGRIVGRRNDDAVGQPCLVPLVVHQDRMRDDGRRCISAPGIDHRLDAIGREHFQGTGKRRLRQRMRVHAHKQRTVDSGAMAIETDGLRDRQDMRLIESGI